MGKSVPEHLSLLPNERRVLVGLASEWHHENGRRIPEGYIEKDFWVTEALRSLSQHLEVTYPGKDGGTARARIVFKGGTSLSKAHGLINRFSEDIDLYVVMRLDPPGFNFISGSFDEHGIGSSRADDIFARLAERVGNDIGLAVVPYEEKFARSGSRRAYVADYARGSVVDGALKAHIQIELTRMGNPEPNSPHKIQSLLADFLQAAPPEGGALSFSETESVTVDVLMPHRTLVEKLCALEQAASKVAQGDGRFTRMARHFYDVDALLAADSVVESLMVEDVASIAADHVALSQKVRRQTGARPDGGFANSVWLTNPSVTHLAREAYESEVPQLTYSGHPTFDEVLTRVRDSASLL